MNPKIRLSRLRDIGFKYWDPIGLLDINEKWDNQPFADEYDSYLIYVADQLRRNNSAQAQIDYLIEIETKHIGLGMRHDTAIRAQKVVEAIQSDNKLWTTSDCNLG